KQTRFQLQRITDEHKSRKAASKSLGIPFSISSCKPVIHNAYMLERFICVSGLNPNTKLIDKLVKDLVLFTSKAA
ncbi:MAG: hypothetical protein MJZ19_11245, partial [Paludibacteraceae bacterium]|nr:hypothetical protein [Paludibacteraceae bacterium]